MYTLIGNTKTRTLRVQWMLEELSLAYDHIPAAPQAPEVLALNPLGRIPVLKAGEDVLTDSMAIMAYLGDNHPDAGPDDGTGGLSHPAGSPARARQDAMVLRLIDEFDALLWTRARHLFVLPENQRVPDVIPVLDLELAQNAGKLAETLGAQPFLMGPHMSIPDILATHVFGWAFTTGVALSPPDNLKAYLKRMRTRPAYRRALGQPA